MIAHDHLTIDGRPSRTVCVCVLVWLSVGVSVTNHPGPPNGAIAFSTSLANVFFCGVSLPSSCSSCSILAMLGCWRRQSPNRQCTVVQPQGCLVAAARKIQRTFRNADRSPGVMSHDRMHGCGCASIFYQQPLPIGHTRETVAFG